MSKPTLQGQVTLVDADGEMFQFEMNSFVMERLAVLAKLKRAKTNPPAKTEAA